MSLNAPIEVQEDRSSPTPGLVRTLGLIVIGCGLFLLTVWAAGAIYIDVRVSWLRVPTAALYLVGMLSLWMFFKRRIYAAGLTFLAFAFVLVWWLNLKPSNNRNWQKDVALLPYADIEGNKVTLHNIRNCDYRTETDFDVMYYDKVLDLDDLRSADLYMVYWGSPWMAHTMVSFGFSGGEYVCFSIETRKEQGENYSAFSGLFRQFELIYIVGDERDVVRLRTNYRQGEEVYLYRLRSSKERIRASFLDYLRRVNSLRMRPEWYNAITQNCTTSIRAQRAGTARAPWDWRMLANGYGDELLYERGVLNTNIGLTELKQRAHINERAKAADKAGDFSIQIRRGVPGAEG